MDKISLYRNSLVIDPVSPLVVYDMDSTLWPFDQKLIHAIGHPEPLTSYYAIGNPALTTEQQKLAVECFHNPDFFRNINFYDGIKDILRPEELGARVRIETNSMTKEISDLRPPQLLAAVDGLTADHIHCHVLESPQDIGRVIPPEVLVAIDDNPHTVSRSMAQMNVMMRIAWNSSLEAVGLMLGKRVRWFNSLHEINDFVYQYVLNFLKRQERRSLPGWR